MSITVDELRNICGTHFPEFNRKQLTEAITSAEVLADAYVGYALFRQEQSEMIHPRLIENQKITLTLNARVIHLVSELTARSISGSRPLDLPFINGKFIEFYDCGADSYYIRYTSGWTTEETPKDVKNAIAYLTRIILSSGQDYGTTGTSYAGTGAGFLKKTKVREVMEEYAYIDQEFSSPSQVEANSAKEELARAYRLLDKYKEIY